METVKQAHHHTSPIRKLVVALVLLVLLPTLFYSAFEFTRLTESEELIGRIYRQQLDVVLFSLNQYAWDVADSWAGEITRTIQSTSGLAPGAVDKQLRELMSLNRGIDAIYVTNADRSKAIISLNAQREKNIPHVGTQVIDRMLEEEQQRIERLSKLAQSGYSRLEAVTLADEQGDSVVSLIFIARVSPRMHPAVAIAVDARDFVENVLAAKMSEAAGDEFILSVTHRNDPRPVVSTDPTVESGSRQSSRLWLFPDYTIGIRLRGETVDELVRSRIERNLILIGLVDLLLIAGAWFVLRTVRREMELAQLKSDFVSNVSHELRTPLSLIRMFAETLQMRRATSEEKSREYIDTIVQESDRLTRLVNNILSFSRIEAGRKEYQFSDVDLNSVTRKILASYETHLKQLGFDLTVDLTDPLPSIRADEEAVSEALINVIDNAVKYSENERSLRVSTGQGDGRVVLEIEDRGIGIAPHDQKRIFEKFFRASDSLVHNTKGSGLGLTLVAHIMNAHGGGVTVQSKPGGGSTFTLWFPLHSR